MSSVRASHRLRHGCIGLLIAVTIYALVGFLVLPRVVKSQLERRLSTELGRSVSVQKVRLNPFALSLTLENFEIKEKSSAAPFVGWKRLYVNFELWASLGRAWVIGNVSLDGFHANVAHHRDGSFNFSDLLALGAKTAGADTPVQPTRAIRVQHMAVVGAEVDFSDQARVQPFKTIVGPLTFTLNEFTTVPQQNAPYGFTAVTEAGETLSWQGVLSANPVSSSGEWKIEHVVLSKYAPYYADLVNAEVADGRISLHGHYDLNLGSSPKVMRLSDGGMTLQDLKIRERGKSETAVELAEMTVNGVNADAVTLKASVANVQMHGGKLAVRRERDGKLNLQSMLVMPTPADPAGKVAGTTPALAPDVTLAEFSLKDFQIDVVDQTAATPAQLGLRHLQVAMKNLTLAKNSPIPLQVAFDWTPRGTVKIEGHVVADPLSAKLKASVAGFELLPLSAYLEQFVNVRLTQGNISSLLETDLSLSADGKPRGALTGDVTLEKFGLVDRQNQDLAGIGQLAVKGIKIAMATPIQASVQEIDLHSPYARVLMNQAGTLNLSTIVKLSDPAVKTSEHSVAAVSSPELMPVVTVGKVSIDKGDFSYADRSIQPVVQLAITDFGGSISGLSSANMARADVDLKASVDGTGPVAITGKLDPLGARKFVDLTVTMRNVDLQPFSPYSGRFAGYELARGKLVLDVKATLEDKKVSANNVITLNQFTFGAATPNPDATGLPVRLGVALLKDLEGKIVIDVPVAGSLDDPNFRIGKVVVRVIVNLLTKAAVSPFSLVGSMFGGGGEELAFQEFAPGGAELQTAEIKKLETMVKALTNRPALNLDFDGSFDRAADGYALKRKKLAEQVRRAVWEEKHALDPNIAPPGELLISAEENAAEVKKLFDAKFPPGTEFGTPLPKTPEVAAPPQPPTGLMKRLIAKVTFRSSRERKAAVAENEKRNAAHAAEMKTVLATGLPLDEMTGRLAENVEISEEDLRGLAQKRAQRVRTYFVETGKIAGDRLFLAQTQTATAKLDRGPRVFLNLQ